MSRYSRRQFDAGVLPLLLVVLIFAGSIFAWGYAEQQCDEKGGTLVRGVFWYECVEAKP